MDLQIYAPRQPLRSECAPNVVVFNPIAEKLLSSLLPREMDQLPFHSMATFGQLCPADLIMGLLWVHEIVERWKRDLFCVGAWFSEFVTE